MYMYIYRNIQRKCLSPPVKASISALHILAFTEGACTGDYGIFLVFSADFGYCELCYSFECSDWSSRASYYAWISRNIRSHSDQVRYRIRSCNHPGVA